MLIQNFSAVELEFNPNDKRVPLKYTQLDNKKIKAMYCLGANFNDGINSPYRPVGIDDIQSTAADFYLNLFDIKGRHVVKDLSFKHLISDIYSINLFDYAINHLIDIEKSYISYSNFVFSLPRNFIYLLNVIYQTQNFEPFSDEINGSVTVEINPTSDYQDIKLKTIVGEQLRNKRIKRILAKSYATESNHIPLSYLDLYCFSGKRIENIPVMFLQKSGQQTVWFDMLDVDVDNSWFRQRGYIEDMYTDNITTALTFIY